MSTKLATSWKESSSATAFERTIEAYYDTASRIYFIKNTRGGWVPVRESSLRRQLRAIGLPAKSVEGDNLSDIDRFINECQTKFDVDYVGPLAGYQSGFREILGKRLLITESPVLIGPSPGDWSVIRKLIKNLLGGETGDEQLAVFYGWLKIAVESLRAHQIRPGQCLVLAGERGCGKSLLQKLITELLGGRMARPYQYMMGQTQFNGDLIESEHLMLEDECSTVDIRTRRNFGSRIKDITVNDYQRLHAKHKNAIRVKPFWRLSVSLNDEPENLMVLPPIDESLEDKIILLKARKLPMPMPTRTNQERDTFWQTMIAELPALVDFLLQFEIPKELLDDRFGVGHFHHPDLLRAINELSPEERLLFLIDEVYFNELDNTGFVGPASQLEAALKSSSTYGDEARKLLHYHTSCGTYLGRLAKRYPERIQYKRSGGNRVWNIEAPNNGAPMGSDAASSVQSQFTDVI